MIARIKNGILFFESSLFSQFKGISHAIFTRHGGHSRFPYEELNISLKSSDAPEKIHTNRSLMADCIDAARPIMFAYQVHGADVVSLKCADNWTDSQKRSENIMGDAMITDTLGMPLAIQLADCQAILMYDPVNSVIANVHAGWRGSIKNIIGKTIQRMQSDFVCQPRDLHAVISPSLGPCCSEFKNYQTEIPEKFWLYRDSRNRFNFWEVSRDQLTAAGVLFENIELSGICTKCNGHLFYSYRKNQETGRFAAVISLTNN